MRYLLLACLLGSGVITAAREQLPRPTTDHQKVHAAYHESRNPSLVPMLESGGSSVWVDAGAPHPDTAVPLDAFLRDRACSADLVVVGHVLAKHPLMTDSNRLIFTDYHLAIRAALRSAQPLIGKTVGLTRLGGTILAHGKQFGLRLNVMPELETTGEYIL